MRADLNWSILVSGNCRFPPGIARRTGKRSMRLCTEWKWYGPKQYYQSQEVDLRRYGLSDKTFLLKIDGETYL
ncbi:MAG: hypothetical protein ACLUHA_08990 [Bacteroides stercoris]